MKNGSEQSKAFLQFEAQNLWIAGLFTRNTVSFLAILGLKDTSQSIVFSVRHSSRPTDDYARVRKSYRCAETKMENDKKVTPLNLLTVPTLSSCIRKIRIPRASSFYIQKITIIGPALSCHKSRFIFLQYGILHWILPRVPALSFYIRKVQKSRAVRAAEGCAKKSRVWQNSVVKLGL